MPQLNNILKINVKINLEVNVVDMAKNKLKKYDSPYQNCMKTLLLIILMSLMVVI